jgi:hypothetical protein
VSYIDFMFSACFRKVAAPRDVKKTVIEGNEKWRVAFGFDKDSAAITSNGSAIIECCTQIATEMFITNKPESKWTVANVGMLRQVIKNCVPRCVSPFLPNIMCLH